MENNPHYTSLKDTLLQKINSQEISMRPKFYFTIKILATLFVAFAILVTTIFVFNFIFFILRINGHETLLGFGTRGYQSYFRLFPWKFLLLDMILIGVLKFLIRHFKFGYKIPTLYLLGGIFFMSFIVGLALDRGTGLNDHFLRQSDDHSLGGPLGGVYNHARRPPPRGEGVCVCSIVSIDKNTLVVRDINNASTTLIIVLPMDDEYATTTGLEIGDTILVAGDEINGRIDAFGVRKFVPTGGRNSVVR